MRSSGWVTFEHAQLQQLLARVAGDRAGRFVDPQQSAIRIDLGNRDRRVLISGREALLALGQRMHRPLDLGDVLENADTIDKSAGAITHGGAHHRGPDFRSVLSDQSLLDRISIDLAGDQPAEFPRIGVAILGMEHVENASTDQLLARSPGDRTRRCVHPQPPTLPIDLRDPDRRMLVGDGETLILLAQGQLGLGHTHRRIFQIMTSQSRTDHGRRRKPFYRLAQTISNTARVSSRSESSATKTNFRTSSQRRTRRDGSRYVLRVPGLAGPVERRGRNGLEIQLPSRLASARI